MISGVCRCEQGLSRYIGKLPTDIIINFLFQHIKIRLRVILGVSRNVHHWNAAQMKFGMNVEWPVKPHAVRILAAIRHLKPVKAAHQSVSQDVNVPQELSMKKTKVVPKFSSARRLDQRLWSLDNFKLWKDLQEMMLVHVFFPKLASVSLNFIWKYYFLC